MAEITVPTKEFLDITRKVVKQVLAERPGLSNDQRRRRPIGGGAGAGTRYLAGQITAVFNRSSGQPKYNAVAIDFPAITVTRQSPIGRDTAANVQVVAPDVGNECTLLKDTDDVWQIDEVMGEVMATEDCQAVAGSRNNMAYLAVTATTSLAQTADWIDVDASAGAVVLTLPEEEVGKRITISKIDSSTNKVTINNTVNGAALLDIIWQYDAPTVAYNGTEWRIV